jgi:ADP-heptose:LPS heptosyltransferase
VRLSALGDVVRTLPAVSSLRAAYPGAHIAWLVEPAAAGALEGQPWVDEVLVFPRQELAAQLRSLAWSSAAAGFARFARRLRRRRFDLVLDFHSLLRSALLARLSGAPRRIAYARPFGRELSYLFATRRARLGPGRLSRFERNQALVRFLGVTAPPSPLPYRVDPAALARAQAALGPGPRPVALHPGSSARTGHKRWPAERHAALARALREREGASCVVTFGPDRSEREAALAVVAASGGAARLAPETPRVADLAALLRACRLWLGGDTGPLHLASLVGTPVVQLLGPTDPVENAPWPGTPSRTLRSASAGAMEFPLEDVLAAARALLAARPDSRGRSRAAPAQAPAPEARLAAGGAA